MIIKIKETDYPLLLDIWESAVRGTHDFLKQEDFLFYKKIFLPTFNMSLYMDLRKTVVWSAL